ncbi:Dipeptide transport system permease protein DppB [subsurface metagenome]
MRAYIIKRLLLVIPILLITSFAIFVVVDIIPGDIVDAMMAQDPEQRLDRPTIERELGLDAPLTTQYGRWLGVVPQMDGSFSGLFQGSLGTSWRRGNTVVELLGMAWPVTFELGLMALIVAQLIALPVGIYSALRQDTAGDYTGRSFAILCISIPSFWLATMIILFPSIWWEVT